MTVSIIMPAYLFDDETRAMTKRSLQAIRDTSTPDEVIVALRGTRDDELVALADTVITPCPVGYARAVNAGVAKSMGDVLVIGSSDALVKPGWLGPLVESVERDGGIASGNHRAEARHGPFCGVLFALSRATWDALGGMDEERFPVRKADQDLAVRADKAGVPIVSITEAAFAHVAPHHTKAKLPKAALDQETALFRQMYGAATYRRWKKLQPR